MRLYIVQKTVRCIDSLDNVSQVGSLLDRKETSGNSRYLSSRITNYDMNALDQSGNPTSQVTSKANPIAFSLLKRGPVDEVFSEMEKDKQRTFSLKDDLLTLLMYRLFGHPTEGAGESQEEEHDVDDELNLEDCHSNAENTAALLRMFDRLLSEGETEDGINSADNDMLKTYLMDKIRSLEGEESDDGLEEITLNADKAEVDPDSKVEADSDRIVEVGPDDVIEADRKGFLSLVKLLGYIPNTDPDVCEDTDPKEGSTESENNRQKVEGM